MISRKTTVSAAALLLASAGAAAAFPATATTDLNVRSGPGTGYSIVDQLQAGDTVEIVATRGSWYQTARGGWASGNFLDAEGGQASYGGGPVYGDYGTAAFYYDDNPYYWDNNAGFYFFIDGGRRHRVGWDWFRDRDHRDFRWSNARFRHDFENRRGNWDGDRQARRGDDNDNDGRRFRRGDADVSAGASAEGEDRRFRRSDADVSAGASVEGEGRRFRRGDADASAGAAVEADQPMRSGRASAGRSEGPRRAGAGDQPVETRGSGGGGGGQGGGAVLPRQGDLPSGGY